MKPKTEQDIILDKFAAWAAGITLLFLVGIVFGSIGFLLYVIARIIWMLVS